MCAVLCYCVVLSFSHWICCFFKQKTAYEMRISDWSSDVCSSDLSALWMVLTVGVLWLFMLGGMKRELVPGRWQATVEGMTNFVASMIDTSIDRKSVV